MARSMRSAACCVVAKNTPIHSHRLQTDHPEGTAPTMGVQISSGGQARCSAGDAHSTRFETKRESPGHSVSGMHRIDKYPTAECRQQDSPFGQSDCASQVAGAPVEVGVPQKRSLSMQAAVPAYASKQHACVSLAQVEEPHLTVALPGVEHSLPASPWVPVAAAVVPPAPPAPDVPPVPPKSPPSETHAVCMPSPMPASSGRIVTAL
jgi:hypothetical protein